MHYYFALGSCPVPFLFCFAFLIAKWVLRFCCDCFACVFCTMWHISLAELLVCLSAFFFVFWHYVCNCSLALFFAILLCTACLIFVPKPSLFICFVCCRFSLVLLAGFPQFYSTDFASCCDPGFCRHHFGNGNLICGVC